MRAFIIHELYCAECLSPLEYLSGPEQPRFHSGVVVVRHPDTYAAARGCVYVNKLFEMAVASQLLELKNGANSPTG